MWNKKKTLGIMLAVTGVVFARIDLFVQIEKTNLFSLNAIGIMLAFAGMAIYASAMPRTVQKAKVCPSCYAKNPVTARTCKQCRKKMPEKEE
jgi:ribosomal protein L40E